jgi:hypothetical protein
MTSGRWIFFFIFFLWPFALLAQNGPEDADWNPGYLVTNEEDTLYGPVSINYASDLVQINEENTVKTFGPNQIELFYYKENAGSEERYIYTFPFHPYSDFKPQKFFEMLFSGKFLCLLGREMIVSETVPVYDNFTYRNYFVTRTREVLDLYFMFPGEKVRAFSGSKKELLSLLSDKKESMKKFIGDNKLDSTKKEDLLLIVREYNRLKAS